MKPFPPATLPAAWLRRAGYGLVQLALLGAWLTGRLRAWQHGLHGADHRSSLPA